jgi:hypothetical protein
VRVVGVGDDVGIAGQSFGIVGLLSKLTDLINNQRQELANALAVRLFGTRRLVIESNLWLASIALVLYTLPSVTFSVLKGSLKHATTYAGLY